MVTGLDVKSREPLAPVLPVLTRLHLPSPVPGPLRAEHAHFSGEGHVVLLRQAWFSRCLVEARLSPRQALSLCECVVPAMLEGIGFDISGCVLGSVTRPDGLVHRPTGDALRPCLTAVTSSQWRTAPPSQASSVVESDILNSHGRYGNQDMHGVQLAWGGNLYMLRVKIDGWCGAAVKVQSDYGPVDKVTLQSCYLGGARRHQLRIVNGGFGRPRNISVLDCCLEVAHPGIHPLYVGEEPSPSQEPVRFVRTERDRRDATWIVYRGNVDGNGMELPPPDGWFDPDTSTTSMVF